MLVDGVKADGGGEAVAGGGAVGRWLVDVAVGALGTFGYEDAEGGEAGYHDRCGGECE